MSELNRKSIAAASISLGYLIRPKRRECVIKAGKAVIKADDVLRCVSCEGKIRTFVNRRTGTVFNLSFGQLSVHFECIGFDGVESIHESSTIS